MRSPFVALRALSGRIVIAVVVCALVMGAAVFQANRYIDHEVAKIPRVAMKTATATGGATNFLIIGSDTRSFVKTEGEKQAFTDSETTANGPARSDTMMVLHADGKNSYAVSFPRDLWVPIPGRGTMKINAAFNDGPQKVIDTLKADFNLDINHYLEVNFKTFEDIVNAVGSVPVYFPHPARDQLSGLDNVWVAGCYHLDGPPALAYVRSRHLEYLIDGKWTDASGLSDIDRIHRQQDFIRKLGGIAVRKTLDDPFIAPSLADTMIPNLTADPGFDRAAFNQLVQAFIGLADGHGNGPVFATLPWESASRDQQMVLLVKEPEADTMLAVLRGEAPVPAAASATAPSSTTHGAGSPSIRPVDVRVRVLNASGVQNAAGNAAEAFTRLGFPGGGTANDPRGTILRSEVRYRPGDEAKARLVAASVPDAQLVADASLPGTDVIVALGKSFRGVGAAATTTVPASGATPTTISPEQACQ
ncbi:MAG: LCP family protein [Acidimicrobiia bacterium]